jgi:ABC-type bacteriocin/lantibiotic exporter with double-glycine peptidase domain
LSLRSIPSIISLNRAYFDLNFFTSSLNSLIIKFKKINFQNNAKITNEKTNDYKDFNFKRDIVFKNISFGYKKNNKILKEINFKVKKNDIVGIVGDSGSGKTTLLLLLFGFIKPNNGKIIIDGLNLNKIVNSWRNCISYAPQDTILTGESLLQNITFKDEISKHDEIRLQSSLAISLSKDFLNSKYKATIIEDKGLNFSGGQRKRLGLARALFLEKDIYILDEPTSFLDNNTINKVYNNLKSFFLNKTVIIISHNEDTLKFCNKIYYLKNKKIFLKKKN